MDYGLIESRLNYRFKDRRLLKRALTLASADGAQNNQVLEFFGDAILEFIVSERIYNESKSEGELTELRKLYVSDAALTPVSEKLGLDGFLIRGPGDSSNKKSIPSAFEAVLAAIYIDGGLEEAKKFVLENVNFGTVKKAKNFKGDLQEYMQGLGYPAPEYETVDIGSAQKHVFKTQVNVLGKVCEGLGESKKQAESRAAENALIFIHSQKNKK